MLVYDKGQVYISTCRLGEATKFSQEENTDTFFNHLYSRWSKYRVNDSFVSYLDYLIEEKILSQVKDFAFFNSDEYEAENSFENIISRIECLEHGYDLAWDDCYADSLLIYDDIDIYLLEDVKARYESTEYEQLWRSSYVDSVTTIPVTLKKATNQSKGFSIPVFYEFDDPIQFDMERVASITIESKEITAKLNAIYEQNNNPILSTPINITSGESHTNSSPVLNLDYAHIGIVKLLATRSEWSRAELKVILSKQGMMLDGVLEHINDAFYDCYNEHFTDSYFEHIEINQDLCKDIFE